MSSHGDSSYTHDECQCIEAQRLLAKLGCRDRDSFGRQAVECLQAGLNHHGASSALIQQLTLLHNDAAKCKFITPPIVTTVTQIATLGSGAGTSGASADNTPALSGAGSGMSAISTTVLDFSSEQKADHVQKQQEAANPQHHVELQMPQPPPPPPPPPRPLPQQPPPPQQQQEQQALPLTLNSGDAASGASADSTPTVSGAGSGTSAANTSVLLDFLKKDVYKDWNELGADVVTSKFHQLGFVDKLAVIESCRLLEAASLGDGRTVTYSEWPYSSDGKFVFHNEEANQVKKQQGAANPRQPPPPQRHLQLQMPPPPLPPPQQHLQLQMPPHRCRPLLTRGSRLPRSRIQVLPLWARLP